MNKNISSSEIESELSKKAEKFARLYIEKSGLPKQINLISSTKMLGNLANRKIEIIHKDLLLRFGDNLPLLAAFTYESYRTSILAGSLYCKYAIEIGHFDANVDKRITSDIGYAEQFGHCSSLVSYLYNMVESGEFLQKTEIMKFIFEPNDVMKTIAIYWFGELDSEVSKSKKINLNLLSEAYEALNYGESYDEYCNGQAQQKVNQAKNGAKAKKAKYQPLKDLAEKLVNEKKFKSRRNAAKTIMSEILLESKKLSIPLSQDQAEITITGWLKELGLPANT